MVAPTAPLKVTAPANIPPQVIASIEAGRLRVDIQGSVTLHQPVRVTASGPSLEAITVEGSGDMSITGLAGKLLRLKVNGSSNLMATGQIDSINA
jgi:hypothetical protein